MFFGVNNFKVAKLMLILLFTITVWEIVLKIGYIDPSGEKNSTILIVFFPIITFLLYNFLVLGIEKYAVPESDTLNPLVPTIAFLRIAKIYFLIVGLMTYTPSIFKLINNKVTYKEHFIGQLSLCYFLYDIVTCSILYLISCNPKPRKPSRVSKLFKKASEVIKQRSPVLRPAFTRG